MSLSTTIVRRTIKELEKLDKFLSNDLDKELRLAEVKAFFVVRHIDTSRLTPAKKVQQKVIKEWEPRAAKLIKPLTMPEYESVRDFLGIQEKSLKNVSEKLIAMKEDFSDRVYKAREIFDLRDEVIESASSTIGK